LSLESPSVMATRRVRIAAVGDLHCTESSAGTLQPLFARVSEAADILLLAGDLTDFGSQAEARVLARELMALRIPAAAVLGNHDCESGDPRSVRQILVDAGVNVLDGEACELQGVGIAGVKGFCGGFGIHALAAWGEEMVKQFVREAVNEALKLESALAHLRTPAKIALMHYSPVASTVAGEPPEILPFIGSSRLEEPIDRYSVTFACHGHAHRGQPDGLTKTGVPVHNVSLPLMTRMFPERAPFRVLEVSVDGEPPS
jgi:Icc-related predicted phosphoesterase